MKVERKHHLLTNRSLRRRTLGRVSRLPYKLPRMRLSWLPSSLSLTLPQGCLVPTFVHLLQKLQSFPLTRKSCSCTSRHPLSLTFLSPSSTSSSLLPPLPSSLFLHLPHHPNSPIPTAIMIADSVQDLFPKLPTATLTPSATFSSVSSVISSVLSSAVSTITATSTSSSTSYSRSSYTTSHTSSPTVAPLPTVTSAPVYQEAGDAGKRTLW